MTITTEDFINVTTRQRYEDSKSSAEDKLSDIEDKLKEIRSGSLKDRVESVQKYLSFGGQAITGLAMHPTAQEGLKAISIISKIAMGASMLALSAAFTNSAKNEQINKMVQSQQKLNDKIDGINEVLNPEAKNNKDTTGSSEEETEEEKREETTEDNQRPKVDGAISVSSGPGGMG